MNPMAMLKPTHTQIEPMQTICLVVDGNSHATQLFNPTAPEHGLLVSEALLPLIRTVAMMMASLRLDFTGRMQEQITDEADWFAARLLVLDVKHFHLDVSLLPMLQTANARAQEFAELHGLPFQAAGMKMSLHAGRANNVLLMDLPADTLAQNMGLLANSLALKHKISLQSHFCHFL